MRTEMKRKRLKSLETEMWQYATQGLQEVTPQEWFYDDQEKDRWLHVSEVFVHPILLEYVIFPPAPV